MENEKKTVYQEKMEAKLTKMKADIQHLEGELKERKADARESTEEKLQRLRQKSDAANAKFNSLKTSSGAAWREAKDGLKTAWSDLESAFHKVSAEFKRQQ